MIGEALELVKILLSDRAIAIDDNRPKVIDGGGKQWQ